MQEIDVNLQTSKFAIVLFTFIILGSLGILGFLSLSVWIKGLGIVLTLNYGIYVFWRHVLLTHSCSVIKIKINQKSCELTTPQGVFLSQLTGDSTVTQVLCVLRFKLSNRYFKKTCVIFKDALGEGQYRRLLVALCTMKLHGISSQNALPSAAL